MQWLTDQLGGLVAHDLFHNGVGINVSAFHIYLPDPVGRPFSQILESSFRVTKRLLEVLFTNNLLNDRGEQGKEIPGLYQIVPCPELHRPHSSILVSLTCDHDNRNFPVCFIQGLQKLDTVHAGHEVIGDDDVRGKLIEPLQASTGLLEEIDRGEGKYLVNGPFHEHKVHFLIINDHKLQWRHLINPLQSHISGPTKCLRFHGRGFVQ